MEAFSATGNETIIKARVTLVLVGYGDLTLTDAALIWNKSASSFLAFGAGNALTENHLMIPLYSIVRIGTYAYFPGGGLIVALNNGKEYKFAFKRKSDFKAAYEYLKKTS